MVVVDALERDILDAVSLVRRNTFALVNRSLPKSLSHIQNSWKDSGRVGRVDHVNPRTSNHSSWTRLDRKCVDKTGVYIEYPKSPSSENRSGTYGSFSLCCGAF